MTFRGFGSVTGFGATVAGPPDPGESSGWHPTSVPASGTYENWTDLEPIPGYEGWLRSIGRRLRTSGVSEEPMTWYLIYGTTAAGIQRVYERHDYTGTEMPPFPSVGVATTQVPGANAATNVERVMALQKALRLADARDLDGNQVGIDGKAGPKTCSACYAFKTSMGLPAGPDLTREFFKYLGLPEAYASAIGSACASYYAGEEAAVATAPPGPGVPTTTVSDVGSGIMPPAAAPPATASVLGGLPWWAGLLAGAGLIGGALWFRGRGKGRKRGRSGARRRRR